MSESDFHEELHSSWNAFDAAVVELIRLMAPARIIDIGAGSGKYARLVQQAELTPKPHLMAIEPGQAAARRLRALSLYDEVHEDDAHMLYAHPHMTTDLVIMGDVLEHLRASDGLDLLHYLTYRSAYSMIITPDCMPHFASSGFYGCHNSFWLPPMFQWHDLWAYGRWKQLQIYLLRGYLDREAMPLRTLVDRFNAMACPVETGQDAPASLQLAVHADYYTEPGRPGYVIVHRPL